MNKNDIEKNMIFQFVRGSQAYGTNTPESDEDIGGICLPINEVLYGIDKFEQDDKWVDENGEKQDKVIYNLTKAVELMLQSNPNMLDFLYAPERVITLTTPIWDRFLDIRDEFLSVKAKWAFQGYAISQLNRIQTHRHYLLNPPKKKPERADYDLPEKSVFPETQLEVIAKLSSEYVAEELREKFYKEFEQLFDKEGALIFKKYIPIEYYPFAIKDFKHNQKQFLHMISSISGIFLKDEYTHMAQNELKFLSANYNWQRYMKWKKGRNKKRAEMEKKCGYDTKHAMHLVRLLTMSVEILQGKGVLVDRTNIDLDLLMPIRDGNIPFEEILNIANGLKKDGDVLYTGNTLPDEPNREKIHDVLIMTLDEHMYNDLRATD